MRLIRLLKILFVLARYRIDRLLPDDMSRPLWLNLFLLPLKLIPQPTAEPAVCLRLAFEDLGPVFVKFGQLLSTRRDLFTDDIFDELSKLQDQVAPFDSDIAEQIVESSLGKPVEALFGSFETTPLASASVAQVHAATLINGDKVVVKIIRPDIKKTIHKDLDLLLLIASGIEKLWVDGRRLHPIQIVRDYERTISDELDLSLEAANSAQLRHNWEGSEKLYVPKIYWEFTHSDILVMERIFGISIDDVEAFKQNKINMKKLAHLGVEIFFTQVFDHNYFHADMNPGNVFVKFEDPDNPQYIALDCSIIGPLSE